LELVLVAKGNQNTVIEESRCALNANEVGTQVAAIEGEALDRWKIWKQLVKLDTCMRHKECKIMPLNEARRDNKTTIQDVLKTES
jgi:hypothetical protein